MESRTCVLFAGHCVRQRHASRAWIPPSTPAPPSSVYRDRVSRGACSVERRALCELMNPYTRQRRQEPGCRLAKRQVIGWGGGMI